MLKIRNTITSKFLGHLKDFAEKNPEDYLSLWNQHGRILKEGYSDFNHKEQVAALFRFNSSRCKDKNDLARYLYRKNAGKTGYDLFSLRHFQGGA